MADRRWEDIVRPHLTQLVDLIAPDSLISDLYAKRILDKDEWEKLRLGSKTYREKTRDLLVDILPRKDSTAFDALVQSLLLTGQKHIVTKFLIPSENGQI